MNFIQRLTPVVLGAVVLLTSACSVSAEEYAREDIEQIVRDYILENPEIIEEAIYLLQERAEQERAAAAAESLSRLSESVYFSDLDPVGGNPEGRVTLVEFFDYNCGYCKRANGTLQALIAANPDLRVVYKEWPILSEGSLIAARISLAVHLALPEQYEQFHHTLISGGSIRNANDVWKVVAQMNLDRNAIESELENPVIDRHLQQSSILTQQLGITGTPAFMVGDSLLKGAYPQADIQAAIDEARS